MSEGTIRVITYNLPEVEPQSPKPESPKPESKNGVKPAVGGATFLDIDIPEAAETNGSHTTVKSQAQLSISNVPVTTLEVEMERLLNVVERLVNRSSDRKKSGMQLEEIELSVEIDRRGKVSLIGSGLDLGSKGAVKLKFKRKSLQ